MLGGLHTLDILGGFDVAGNNCVLKQNKTQLLGRGPYDYIQGLRDEMVVNRGYDLPPYHQESWSFEEGNFWTPDSLTNLETWFGPEYFHPETNNTTLCVQMENRSTTDIASANAVQNTEAYMPTLTTDSSILRGLTTLDFDGGSDGMEVDSLLDWNVATDSWFCCVLLQGPSTDTNDKQHILTKGARWSFSHDYSGGSKDAVFDLNDGSSSVSITQVSAALEGSKAHIYSFGRFTNDSPFLYSRVGTVVHENTISAFNGSLNVSSKPKIGFTTAFGSAKHFDGGFVGL